MPGPLDGVKILEFTQIVAGPFGGSLLTDMGAQTIKVEPLRGDPTRLTQQMVPMEGRGFVSLNRGKRSLPLDMSTPEAQEIVHKMVPDLDVVLINYRPDVPVKLGIDYDTLAAINPKLIYCQNSGFGLNGPLANLPGSDIVTQAMTGLLTGNNNIQDGLPTHIQATPVADVATGITIAWGITAALLHREKTGQGQKIEASLMGTSLALQSARFMVIDAIDKEQREEFLGNLDEMRRDGKSFEEMQEAYRDFRPRPPGNIYYRTYKTKTGLITVGCLSDEPKKRMAEILGLHDIRWDDDYDATSQEAVDFGAKLNKDAEAKLLEKTSDDWIEIFRNAKVPVIPVYVTEELPDHDQVIDNDNIVDLEHPLLGHMTMYGPTLKMSETPLHAQRSSPAFGENTDEILADLGYSEARIGELRDRGVTL